MADVSGGRSAARPPVGDTTGHDECNTRPDNVCHSTHADPVATQPTPVGGHFIDGRWHGCDPNYCDLDHGVAPPAQPQPADARYRVADAIRYEVRTQLGLQTGDYLPVHWESVADAAIAALEAGCL